MKKIIIAAVILASSLAGCTAGRTELEQRRSYISWVAFCASRGYNIDDNTYQATNEYLDTWCGSVEEEAALIEAGVKPY